MCCGRKNSNFSESVAWLLDISKDYLQSKFKLHLTLFTGGIAPNLPKLDPMGQQAKKNRDIFWVKSRTRNTQKLKVMDPETAGGWSYYRLCEIFCGPFGWAPGGNLDPIFQIGPKLTDNF